MQVVVEASFMVSGLTGVSSRWLGPAATGLRSGPKLHARESPGIVVERTSFQSIISPQTLVLTRVSATVNNVLVMSTNSTLRMLI
jgi:hypothetical protein